MAISDITEALALKEFQNPQMEFNWMVTLPRLNMEGVPMQNRADITASADERATAILTNANGWAEAATGGYDHKNLSHRVYSIELPNTSYESSKNTFKGAFWYGALGNDIGTITMTVDEYEDGATLRYFTDWMHLIKNEDGSFNPPALYKRTIIHHAVNGAGDKTHETKYIGFFPTEITPISWSYDGSNVLQYSITLTGDSVSREAKSANQPYEPIEVNQDIMAAASAKREWWEF